jgi:hypothetical protein
MALESIANFSLRIPTLIVNSLPIIIRSAWLTSIRPPHSIDLWAAH